MSEVQESVQCEYVLVYQDRAVACPPECTNFFEAHKYQVLHMQDTAGEVITCSLESYREIAKTISTIIESHPGQVPSDLWVGVGCGTNWVEFAGVFDGKESDRFEDALEAFEAREMCPMWIYSADVALEIFSKEPSYN